ncbi:bifunctional 3,4-dihydroxy-2-butanone-4-phosphate synthase/GTP cyclohydrolase II [Staphylococcus succinus]|jgi:3,4-dihydroxy 2-butanone 4-phosphate synthase/GTP cyclohydrolase II|uniref:bifunctional 3,4-dihydroxy-2-butanone-4-phosphate synthase/GTP cyclohydrolase II n=1 Tax=Staphylococcus succinus TaxID=61015 RepID=UPI0009379280|nr:bifunctional 3,4-dihydroxy-2-butanone-4-phosphate synthase/GTP cyclohydrolase II [Staphylococcus succinus]MEB8209061.1 bifunctional 3,4-dihydroxy-2-butanone-4-phosphate synthase/GTP cyclohydrolase II [Staphylococcus succinus]PTJ15177.1 bifunctional 3,4-dihydroxy-2-butanone-4-phosphate synthase/GTP cyclohydrolase II [Staphylococcus succinus]RIN35860.1 bifunctional 3,4-dihydroxy-2-butanone-4-phosphate synthase/GTP cyclohydrolase II [Staphylococcus succinus]
MKLDSIDTALKALKNGDSIIVVDDENRENEGDLVAVTEWMKDNTVNFMATYGRGLICAPISHSIAEKLDLNPMVNHNSDVYGTQFTVSVDHVNTTTGISAVERTMTARALIDDHATSNDFNKPGHLFPLIAQNNGVLSRLGHTEASVDLATLSGAKPAALICEIMNEDGSMAKGEELERFKEEHQLVMISIEDLVKYRQTSSSDLEAKAKVKMPTEYGEFDMYGFTTANSNEELVAIVSGEIKETTNVRIHSACLTGDIFHSQRCDCGEQLAASMKYINEHGGVILYLPQEGRGIGLINKLKAYELIEQGYDTVTANIALGFEEDLRDYKEAAQILKYFGIEKVNLLSNNPKKFESLEIYGIDIAKRIELVVPTNKHNQGYMDTKKVKMGHLI